MLSFFIFKRYIKIFFYCLIGNLFRNNYLISKHEISEYAGELIKSLIIEFLEFIRSARKSVFVLPKRSQIILGGCPFKFEMSKKSASNFTIVNLFCFAYCQISISEKFSIPSCLTCFAGGKLEVIFEIILKEIFWSNNKLTMQFEFYALCLQHKQDKP